MGNITALDIGSNAAKLTGRTVDQQGAGASLTAGDQLLIAGFDPESSEAKESKGYLDDVSEGISSAPSQFNPFNVFRYRRFGTNKDSYDITKHKDSNLYGEDVNGLNQAEDNSKSNIFAYVKNAFIEPQTTKYNIGNFQREVRNPTAKQIIDASRNTEGGAVGPAPYAFNDFIYCTHYGKIPNNRLVTLRRYPKPVEDRLIDDDNGLIHVPLAQALTYFGEGTTNKLDQVLPISWDVKWESLEADVKDITGNEVIADDILAGLGVVDPTNQDLARAAMAFASGQDNNLSVFQLSGYDVDLQSYIKEAYSSEKGPYWNRVLGPVNVINQSRKRTRGMGSTMFDTPIRLKFSFSLRSFNLINPKVAMLDLISNFLTLTYNTAPFWGGGYRYFPRTGVPMPLGGSDKINRGDLVGGILETFEGWLKNSNGQIKEIIDQLAKSFASTAGIDTGKSDTDGTETDITTGDTTGFAEGGRNVANLLLAAKMSGLMQSPLTYRSILEGRAIGEWHMTVGNPLDPMAVMGNLICTACAMSFSEELGADDFPKEIMFDVTLKHGKPRAKQDIESIFNLGGGPLSFSKLNPPSSAQQTFSNDNSNNVVNGIEPGTANNPSSSDSNVKYTNAAEPQNGEALNAEQAAAQFNIYRGRVTSHYGEQFGNSAVLYDYIKKTKS